MFVRTIVSDKMLTKHLTVNSVQYKESTGRVLVPFSPLCVRHQQVYATVLEERTKINKHTKKQTQNPGRRVPQRKKSICREECTNLLVIGFSPQERRTCKPTTMGSAL